MRGLSSASWTAPTEPAWLVLARSYIGLAEIPGKETAPTIRKWLIDLRAWWTDDETPWCGVFVAACMREVGQSLPKHWYRAKGWLEWGIKLTDPRLGCVVVYERKGGGHVGFAVGRDSQGNIMTLGGNQGNKVSIAPFDKSRVIEYRWPDAGTPGKPLPTLASDGRVSTQEG